MPAVLALLGVHREASDKLTGVSVVSSVQHMVTKEEDRGSNPRGLEKERKRRPQHNPQSGWPSEHGRHGAARLAQVKQVTHTC